MNLNANQLKVLQYLKDYLGKELPSHRQMALALGMSNSNIIDRLNALQRAGLIQVEETGKRHNAYAYVAVLRYWREPDEEPQGKPQGKRLTLQSRAKVLAEGTRR